MRERFERPLNLLQFSRINDALAIGIAPSLMNTPTETQMILRMCVESPYSRGMQVPPEIHWLKPAISLAKSFQRHKVRVTHPYTYITVRHGMCLSEKDDEWHVDGFSMRNTHLPDANYVASTGPHTTEYAFQPFDVPLSFDPLKHNINQFLAKRVEERNIRAMAPMMLYFIDPYVVHRRPPLSKGTQRTFIRVSFTNLEIPDINNTVNPMINTSHYTRDGVKDFRNLLTDFDEDRKYDPDWNVPEAHGAS